MRVICAPPPTVPLCTTGCGSPRNSGMMLSHGGGSSKTPSRCESDTFLKGEQL